jgi:hypothetical protein
LLVSQHCCHGIVPARTYRTPHGLLEGDQGERLLWLPPPPASFGRRPPLRVLQHAHARTLRAPARPCTPMHARCVPLRPSPLHHLCISQKH